MRDRLLLVIVSGFLAAGVPAVAQTQPPPGSAAPPAAETTDAGAAGTARSPTAAPPAAGGPDAPAARTAPTPSATAAPGVAGAEGAAHGVASGCLIDPKRYRLDRSRELLAQPGERLLAELRRCEPTVAASVEEAIRYAIQTDEARIFARHRRFVLAAYGVAWGLVALAALGLYLRQRRLLAQLAELEARVRAAGEGA